MENLSGMKGRNSKQYAVYKKDDLLVMGTIEECAKALKVKPDTVLYYGSKTYQSRGTGKNRRITILVEDDGE